VAAAAEVAMVAEVAVAAAVGVSVTAAAEVAVGSPDCPCYHTDNHANPASTGPPESI
jgi:hypothetical protein